MKYIILKSFSVLRDQMYRLMPKYVQQIGCMSMVRRAQYNRFFHHEVRFLYCLPACARYKKFYCFRWIRILSKSLLSEMLSVLFIVASKNVTSLIISVLVAQAFSADCLPLFSFDPIWHPFHIHLIVLLRKALYLLFVQPFPASLFF